MITQTVVCPSISILTSKVTLQRTPTKISNAMEKNLTSGLQNYLQIFATKCQHLFAEEEARAVSKRVAESYASLLGVGLGGGLFIMVVMAGVIFWISRERAEDEQVAEEAEKFHEGRRRGRAISVDVEPRAEKYIVQDFGLYRNITGKQTH